MRTLKLNVFGAALLAALTGCAGGSGGSGAAAPVSAASSGRLVLSIQWPASSAGSAATSRLIPAATSAIQLTLNSITGYFAATGTNTLVVTVPSGTPTATVSGVPAGQVAIQARAILTNADGTTTTLAQETGVQANVVANQSNPVTLNLLQYLTAATTQIVAKIVKIANADGTPVTAADPEGTPQVMGAHYFVENGATYEVTATLLTYTPTQPPVPGVEATPTPTPTLVELPATNEFQFFVTNFKGESPLLTLVNAAGASIGEQYGSLSDSVFTSGRVFYFKAHFAPADVTNVSGSVSILLNEQLYGDPLDGTPTGAAPLGALCHIQPQPLTPPT